MAEETSLPAPESINGSLLGKYYSRLSIGKYKRPSPFTVSEYKVDTIINLPLPTELSDSTTVGYAGSDFESVGDAANGDLSGAAESFALRNATSFAADTAGAIAGIILIPPPIVMEIRRSRLRIYVEISDHNSVHRWISQLHFFHCAT
jgi:hypothetical protein